MTSTEPAPAAAAPADDLPAWIFPANAFIDTPSRQDGMDRQQVGGPAPCPCPWPFPAPQRLPHGPLYPKYLLGGAVSLPLVPRLAACAGGRPCRANNVGPARGCCFRHLREKPSFSSVFSSV